MKTIIQKRADQLEVGDIIQTRNKGQQFVRNVSINQGIVTFDTVTSDNDMFPTGQQVWEPHVLFDIVSHQLTPAQQHAAELLDALRRIETPLAVAEQGRRLAVLAKIEPLPTPADAWAALDEVMRGPSMSTTQSAWKARCNSIRDMVARARAAGVFK